MTARRRLALGALAAAMCGPAAAQAPDPATAPELPPLTTTRYDEAWSVLADPVYADTGTGRVWSGRLKYIPLTDDGSVYLTLGMELRARNEDYRNNVWDSVPDPDNGYLWLRALPYADLHAGPTRAFVQPIIAYAVGVEPKPSPVDQTRIDILQAFADYAVPLAGNGTLTVRGGREMIGLGSERLVGTRYGPNVPLAFDGGRVIVEHGPWVTNLLAVRPVEAGPDSFDDKTSTSRTLWGIYATYSGLWSSNVGADVYYLGYRNDDASFQQGSGRELRHTLGVRLFDSADPLHFNIEGMVQFGRFAGGSIGAWSLATEVGRRFEALPFSPDFTMRVNVASGDGDPDDDHLGTFNALFPKGKYFGELSPIGPYNIINVNPRVDLDLGHGWAAGLSGGLYWRASTGDGIYDIPGHLIRSGEGTDARFIGTQAEVTVEWQASRALGFSASASLFTAGEYIRQSGPSATIGMLGFEAGYRF
ncbi:alginate export family protein [Acuticoccus sediminis]|nr:alginate export family protein [Acuticoccus sediminis]